MKLLLYWLDIGSGHKPGVNHGLAWISSFLRSRGHKVIVNHITDSFTKEMAINSLLAEAPDVVGFSLTTNQRRFLDQYVSALRIHFTGLMIAGGIHATLAPDDVLNCSGIDGVCIGEGEYPLDLLGNQIDNKSSHINTPSFWWKVNDNENATVVRNDILPFEHDLSKFPFPDYTEFRDTISLSGLGGFANIMISRGCPYDCTYCCNHALKQTYSSSDRYFRILPPEDSMQLLQGYLNIYPETTGFIFEDDLLITNSSWFRDFADLYKNNIGLPYICNGRFEHIQDAGLVNAIKDSGCRLVQFGLESGDQEFRRKMLKRYYTDKQIFNTVNLLNSSDIKYFTYNIFGFPFETKQNMKKTVALNIKIRPHSGMSFFFYPYPRTYLYDICSQNDLLQPNLMDDVSGYREMPVITLTNCKVDDCIYLQRKLMLYFIARRLTTALRINSRIIDSFIHMILMTFPSIFVNLFTKENVLKKLLRYFQYKRI